MKPFGMHALWGLRCTKSRLASRSCWVCPSCQPRHVRQCRWSSSDGSPKSTDKPYYITTPIFYVNAAPHIGHLYTMVLTDVLKRWQQINGNEAFLCTGTDEHGMKIQRAAAKEGMHPKEFCDSNSNKFRELAASADIAHDFFIRTTDAEHKEAVKQFWLQLKHGLPEKLGLYKGSHEGWYAVSDECFYPEDMVQPSIVPQTGKKIMVSVETDSEVEWIKEETWFFPLTKYKDALLKFYDENPDWITPAHRMNEVRNWVENHLEDLSITRPVSRLSWGIPDPEDSKQTIYVWVDALINYITKAGYGTRWHSASDDMGLWPADLQVIGKDILRFHTIYWPALLMALDLPLPKRILCHNHWTMSNRKMSKSLGNVVNPFFAVQRWDVDPLRYFLMRNGSFSKDMSYSNQLIGSVYAKDLKANIGNLFYRIARPKVTAKWSTKEAVATYRDGGFQDFMNMKAADSSQERYFSLESHLKKATPAFCEEMDYCNTGGAIRAVFNLLRETNRYVSDTEPWNLVKNPDPESRALLNWVIFNSAEALRIAGILLQPIMPTKASELLNELGVKPERRTVQYARKGKDVDYGTEAQPSSDKGRTKKWDTIFPPTPNANDSDAEVMEQLRTMLQSKTKNKMNQMAELLAMEARMGEEAVTKLRMNHSQDESQVRGMRMSEGGSGTAYPGPGLPNFNLSRTTSLRHASRKQGNMRINEKTAIATSQVLLVPYEAHHVLNYHGWMQDPSIQEATASEPMSLEEEYENQQSWRTARDKLTFIVCEPLQATPDGGDVRFVRAKDADADDRMRGDINFFLYPDEEEEDTSQNGLIGEVDVMIADTEHRGQGFGGASVRALLTYLQRRLAEILKEHTTGDGSLNQGDAKLTGLMAKIKQGNVGSRALFQKLGFRQRGEVNYFGEVTMVMEWGEAERRVEEWARGEVEGYREVVYGVLADELGES
ncbi:Putative methionine--tRNA ligase, mitochondrial [Tolypocladium paradoxum]|uniref:Probable methionine--tRNA ligase, mitochondrial n=1 Tax=Tolypocladium paradoxum TaxID=94208 RepID=A0A2S4L6N2_9HYPO|nr:Putative methionine--tRNA ligase, mitochondrial [Tolypocladium paradoxum]